MRRVLLTGLVLAAGLVAAALTCSEPAPADSPAGTIDAAERAGRALAVELQASPLALRAGAAEVALEIDAGAPLGGYLSLQDRTARAAGTVAVSALALGAGERTLVITGFDAVTVTPALRQAIAARWRAPTALVTTATHTHSGPGGFGQTLLEAAFLSRHDARHFGRIARAHVEAASAALSHMQPARLRHGAAPAHDLIANRSAPGKPIDPTVDLVELAGARGPIGRLVTFGAHPTLVGARDRLDGDYPAALRAVLEERGEPFPTLFAAAATGSASCQRPPRGSAVRHVAAALASVVRGVPLAEAPAQVRLAHARAELAMPPPCIPVAAGWVLRPWLSRGLVPERLPIDVLRLGPVVVAVLPGELSGEVTEGARRRFRDHGLHLVIASHNGVYAGYFMPAARYGQPGPERALELYGPYAAATMVAFLDGVRTGLVALEQQDTAPRAAPKPIPLE